MMRRGFSSAARTVEQKISKLPNGLTVASIENGAPISQLVLAFRAGTRYEQPDEQGFVHYLRNSVGTDSKNYLGVKLLWQTGNIGATLNSFGTKDIFAVQLATPREGTPIGVSLLGELGQPAFKPWEVADIADTIKTDLNSMEAYDIVIEMLHKAAFRNGGLGRSNTAKPYNVGKINHKKLESFAKSRLLTGEAAIIGINVNHDLLLQYASEQITLPEGKGKEPTASPYKGGEVRLSGPGNMSHVAVTAEGAKLSDLKSVATQAVLASLIAGSPVTKFSSNNGFGVVAKTINKESQSPVGVTSVNISYSDNGLVGFYLVTEGSQAGILTKKAIAAVKSLASDVNAEAFEIAKQQTLTEILLRCENDSDVAIDQAVQILSNANPISPVAFTDMVQSVTIDDVKKAASKFNGKLSISSYGVIDNVPYLDEL
uniref:Cytochrome b-c1 complex subunit 2, mitochondrial n=1 Tax=Strongyloides papillosus TaxID=174720 RepID=A0A0N5BFE1_STREA